MISYDLFKFFFTTADLGHLYCFLFLQGGIAGIGQTDANLAAKGCLPQILLGPFMNALFQIHL